MSIHFTGRAARRGLAVLTTAAVVCGLAAGVPSATAATKKKNDRTIATAIAPKASTLTAGRYVVVLRDDAATRYDGGVAGLKATAATNGKSFDARSDKVAAYQAYLTKRQNGIASGVGAEVMSRSTLSASSFTARLSSKQATDLSQSRDVMMVVKDTAFSLDTYKSPEFLGLVGPNNTPGVWAANGGVDKAGAGVVVGILDSGIWPESGSFAGTKIDRNPTGPFSLYRKGNTIYMKKKDGTVFRGVCQPGEKWNVDDCNSKIVGARYYPDAFLDSTKPKERFGAEFISTRDGDGHGSHTASTAAGNHGVDAAVEGRYFGKVSGIAPAAKIAAYKVCFSDLDPNTGGCYTSSTLSAVDDAIADGVDVINYSISGATNTVVDAVEFAFLNAAAAGVFVATSAGNSGPTASTVAHNSPWVTTVAASTHVNYENTLVLDNASEDKYKGASITDQVVGSTSLVDSTSIPAAATEAGVADATLCGPGSLTAAAAGKIVICTRGAYDRVAKSAEVKRAGGSAMILANSQAGQSLDADFHSVPTIHVDKAAGDAIKAYAATAGATASFALGNTTGVETPVPQVAGFSSRGPAVANSADVIKPDISAPGVSVLAAVAPPSGGGRSFDLYSGTSMSSPHVAGLAAFMMGVHPEWSPMAVKSAMMTTAYDLKKADGSPDTNPFNEGAGHVDPKKFLDPGLVVTSTPVEWIGFIKGQGASIPGTDSIPATPATDLNIPSMAKGQVTSSVVIKRTFTALRAGTWDVAVSVPGFEVELDKSVLTFTAAGQKQTVTFTFTRTGATLGQFSTGFATLTGPTVVRLPVALRPVAVSAPAEVTGTGAPGSADVAITAGFTGSLVVEPSGLAKATSNSGDLAVGAVYDDAFEIAADTKFARFDLDAIDDRADLDLYVYRLNAAGVPVALAGQSATGSADERVTLVNPMAGKYLVEVDGYSAAPGGSSIAYRYDRYLVTPATTLGDLAADPNPVPVTQGQPTTFRAVWSALETGRYLGALEYAGALAPTFVTVDVP